MKYKCTNFVLVDSLNIRQRHGGLMVTSALTSGSSGLGSSPGLEKARQFTLTVPLSTQGYRYRQRSITRGFHLI